MSNETNSPTQFDSIDDALAGLRQGKLVIVVDAQDRENEGDFIGAAEFMTASTVSFMLREACGMMCAPMAQEVAERLQFTYVVDDGMNTASHKTQFLVHVDHRDSGTGISAEARALTLRELANPDSKPRDFLKPGHIPPLQAKDGGVLRRAGHTEATVDLLRMAGLQPVGVCIEILSKVTDQTADVDELKRISVEHDIPMITIEDLIRHRRLREQLVQREVEVTIDLEAYGQPKFIAYSVSHEDQEPLAIVWGDPSSVKAPLIRMHSSCFTGDVLGSLRCDCGDQLQMAMEMIHREGTGAIVYLPQEGRGIGLVSKLKAYKLQDQGLDTVEANHKLGFKADHRDYMIGLQILKDMGLSEIRLLTNNPNKTEVFPAWDVRLVEQVPIVAPSKPSRAAYMATKREKMGHILPPA